MPDIKTDQNGIAIIKIESAGEYLYNVQKEGYNSVTGTVTIENADKTIEVTLVKNEVPTDIYKFSINNSAYYINLSYGQETNVNLPVLSEYNEQTNHPYTIISTTPSWLSIDRNTTNGNLIYSFTESGNFNTEIVLKQNDSDLLLTVMLGMSQPLLGNGIVEYGGQLYATTNDGVYKTDENFVFKRVDGKGLDYHNIVVLNDNIFISKTYRRWEYNTSTQIWEYNVVSFYNMTCVRRLDSNNQIVNINVLPDSYYKTITTVLSTYYQNIMWHKSPDNKFIIGSFRTGGRIHAAAWMLEYIDPNSQEKDIRIGITSDLYKDASGGLEYGTWISDTEFITISGDGIIKLKLNEQNFLISEILHRSDFLSLTNGSKNVVTDIVSIGNYKYACVLAMGTGTGTNVGRGSRGFIIKLDVGDDGKYIFKRGICLIDGTIWTDIISEDLTPTNITKFNLGTHRLLVYQNRWIICPAANSNTYCCAIIDTNDDSVVQVELPDTIKSFPAAFREMVLQNNRIYMLSVNPLPPNGIGPINTVGNGVLVLERINNSWVAKPTNITRGNFTYIAKTDNYTIICGDKLGYILGSDGNFKPLQYVVD